MNESSFDHRVIDACVAVARSAVTPGTAGPSRVLIDRISQLTGFSSVAVTVVTADGGARLVAVTNEQARIIDSAQLLSGAGPLPDCLRRGHDVALSDLEISARRWPEFRRAVSGAGVQSMMVTALRAEGRTVGVVSMYSDRAIQPPAPARRAVAALAQIAAVGLVVERERASIRRDAHERARATQQRTEFDQASGVLAVVSSVPVREAAEAIRRWAGSWELAVPDVVTGVIDREIPALLPMLLASVHATPSPEADISKREPAR